MAVQLAGYQQAGPVADSFLQTWRVALILGELAGVLRRREPPAQADASVQLLLGELAEGR